MPAPKRDVRAKESIVGDVRVREDGDNVLIQWSCGASRTFTKEKLREVLKNFESLGKAGDVYYRDTDIGGQPFFARLDGKVIRVDDNGSEAADSVNWAKFRAAVVRHSKAPAKRKTPAKKATPSKKST